MVAGGEGKKTEGNTDTHIGLHAVYQYLPQHDAWVERAPLPEGRFRGAGMYLQGAVQVLGGHRTCQVTYFDDDTQESTCHKTTFQSHVAYYDLNTPDIFVYVRRA